MEHAYKSHRIVITTWASLDRNGYTPEVRAKAPNVFQTLKLNIAFATKEQAENSALEVAKKWIDDDKPKYSQAATTVGEIRNLFPLSDSRSDLESTTAIRSVVPERCLITC